MITDKEIIFQNVKREVEYFLKKERLIEGVELLSNSEWRQTCTTGFDSPFCMKFLSGAKLARLLLKDGIEENPDYYERIELGLSDIFEKYDYFFELDDDTGLYLSHL